MTEGVAAAAVLALASVPIAAFAGLDVQLVIVALVLVLPLLADAWLASGPPGHDGVGRPRSGSAGCGRIEG